MSNNTHKCDGCDDEKPCGGCAGNIDRASSAYQALEWAWRGPAAPQRLMEPWKRAAYVFDAVSRVRDRQPAPEADALARFVRDSIVATTTPEPAGGAHAPIAYFGVGSSSVGDGHGWLGTAGTAALRVVPLFASRLRAPKVWPQPPDEFKLPTPSASSGNSFPGLLNGAVACCVDMFAYPDDPPVRRSIDAGPGGFVPAKPPAGAGALVWAAFSASAKFRKGDLDPNSQLWCVCACCEFRQYIVYVKTVADGPRTTADTDFKGIEDCIWYGATGTRGKQTRTRKFIGPASPTPARLPGETDVYGPFCYGQRNPPAEVEGVTGEPDDDYFYDCNYRMSDRVGFVKPLPNGTDFSIAFKFIGVIHDACNFWLPVAWGIVELPEWSGTVLGDAAVSDTKEQQQQKKKKK